MNRGGYGGGRGGGGGGGGGGRGGGRGGGGGGRGGRGGTTAFRHKHQSAGEGIDEQFRIDVNKALAEFRAGNDEVITFPASLNSYERRFVHYIAGQLGMVSKSSGKGEARQLSVRKKRVGDAGPGLRAPPLPLCPESEDAIDAFMASRAVSSGDWDLEGSMEPLVAGAEALVSQASTAARRRRGGGGASGRASDAELAAWAAAKAAKEGKAEWKDVLFGRMRLPAWNVKESVIAALRASQVVIVSGETGSGKTTQVPQFILDCADIGPSANMVVTQPRRISAISVAERVAWERCEDVGATVGYNVRLESASSAATRLLFMTTGVLLRRLTSDPELSGVTHVILDEVHERDVYTDFLLIILRDLLPRRPDLKLIVMSATIQIDLFVSYFRGGGGDMPVSVLQATASSTTDGAPAAVTAIVPGGVSTVHIEGATFPVTRYYLEDALDHTGFMISGGAGHTRLASHGKLAYLKDPTFMKALEQGKAGGVKAAEAATPTPTPTPAPAPSGGAGTATAPLVEDDDDDDGDTIFTPTALSLTAKLGATSGSSATSARPRLGPAPKTADIGLVTADALVCKLCARRNFKSTDAFAMHAALCMGPGTADSDEEEEEEGAGDGDDAMTGPPAPAPAPEAPLLLSPASTATVTTTVSGTGSAAVDVGDRIGAVVTSTGILLPGGSRARREAAAAAGIDAALPPGTNAMVDAYAAMIDDSEMDYELLVAVLEHIVMRINAGHDAVGGGSATPTAGGRGHKAAPSAAASGGQPAILVFLPGWEEISRSLDALREHPVLGDPSRVLTLALHSAIPTVEQRRVFKRPPPGVTKIILSTNIAETSITIDDVVYVIDSGRVREKTYDAYTGCSSLQSVWTSRASAKQRAGRAGRVRPGVTYHLFSNKRHASMPQFTVPEMLRTPLEELCLQIKLLNLNGAIAASGGSAAAAAATGGGGAGSPASAPPSDVEAFLAKAIQPPAPAAIRTAIRTLHAIGALEPVPSAPGAAAQDKLTPLGYRLAQLPMSPRLAKMVLYAVLFKCLDPVLTIACAMSYRPPWLLPMTPGDRIKAEQARLALAGGHRSDHLALLGAYTGFHAARARGGGAMGNGAELAFCRQHFLSPSSLNMVTAMRDQMVEELVKCGALSRVAGGARGGRRTSELLAAASVNAKNTALVLAVLTAGIYPQVARANPFNQRGDGGAAEEAVRAGLEIRDGSKTMLHPSSVTSNAVANRAAGGGGAERGPPSGLARQSTTAVEWLLFEEMSKGNFGAVTLKTVSVVPALALALLCTSPKRLPAAPVAGGKEEASAAAPGALSAKWLAYEDTIRRAAAAARGSFDPRHLVAQVAAALSASSRGGEEEDEEEDGDEDEDEEGGGGKRAPGVATVLPVDTWIGFTLPPARAVPFMYIRNRLILAFHRAIIVPEVADAMIASGALPATTVQEDEEVVALAATLLTLEVLGPAAAKGLRLGPGGFTGGARAGGPATIMQRPATADGGGRGGYGGGGGSRGGYHGGDRGGRGGGRGGHHGGGGGGGHLQPQQPFGGLAPSVAHLFGGGGRGGGGSGRGGGRGGY